MIYRGEDWHQKRMQALIRDRYTCQKCGSKEKLSVHHLRKWKDTKDNSLENLISLCLKCHKSVENRQDKSQGLPKDIRDKGFRTWKTKRKTLHNDIEKSDYNAYLINGKYTVRLIKGKDPICECEAYLFNQHCSHIYSVEMLLKK